MNLERADTHIHASQMPNAGIFGKTTLLSWLQKYTFPLEASLSDLAKARAVYGRCVRRTLAHGTTAAAYYATVDAAATNLLADVCHAAGQRAFVGRCSMDTDLHPDYYRDADADAALSATQRTIDHIAKLDPRHDLVTPILTPRFAPSCTETLLTALGALAREKGLPVQTHLAENHAEIALVARTFPQHESYTHVYDAHGLLTPRTVLAHACHLAPAEVALVRARGSGVAHCPVSNAALGSGVCPVREYLDAGVPVGLGTDVSGGWSPSVLTAGREAAGVSRWRTAQQGDTMDQAGRDRLKLSVEEALYLATRGGARCMGLQDKVGAFEVGMEWDAQFVDLGPVLSAANGGEGGWGNVEVWEGTAWEDVLAKWMYCGDDRNTRAVWVKGRLVSGSMER